VSRLLEAVSLCALICAMGAVAATAAAAPPAVSAEAATEVTASTARAHGRVEVGGEETFYHFEYISDLEFDRNQTQGKDPFTGSSLDGFGWLPASSGEVSVAPLLGQSAALEGATQYHLRLVAENLDGSRTAVAPSFTTPQLVEPIPCFGDSCQALPSEPRDPPLGTTVAGLGNPKPHYSRYGRKKRHKHRRGHRQHGAKKGKRAAARTAR
jgi:hypothetical protein